MKAGAMPFLHRWWGNPMFSLMARWMFKAPMHDVYCGMRGFTKELYNRLDLRCMGMEFATEMIIKASLHGGRYSGSAYHAASGWPEDASAAPEDIPGWVADVAVLLYVFATVAVPDSWCVDDGSGNCGICLGAAGDHDSWHYVRCAHTLLVSSLAMLLGYQAIWFAAWRRKFLRSVKG